MVIQSGNTAGTRLNVYKPKNTGEMAIQRGEMVLPSEVPYEIAYSACSDTSCANMTLLRRMILYGVYRTVFVAKNTLGSHPRLSPEGCQTFQEGCVAAIFGKERLASHVRSACGMVTCCYPYLRCEL